MPERKTEVKIVDLKECNGDLKQINKTINDGIKVWMKDVKVSISRVGNIAVIIFDLDISTQEKLIAYCADEKINMNIPCFERVL